jgi:hypothetical protein
VLFLESLKGLAIAHLIDELQPRLGGGNDKSAMIWTRQLAGMVVDDFPTNSGFLDHKCEAARRIATV